MILYYIRIAWRNISRQIPFYALNVGGLAVGLAACLIISHFVYFHSSFDTYQPDSARTYRLNYSRTTENGEHIKFASATPTIGGILTDRMPQIELLGLAYKANNVVLYNDNYSHDQGFFWGESAMIELLGLEVIYGHGSNALERSDQIVISESLARNYFRDTDPVGQRLYVNSETSYEVSAVFRDVPANSHFPVDAFVSFEVMREALPHVFANGHFMSQFYNYLRLQKDADPEVAGVMIQDIVEEVYEQELRERGFYMQIELQPIEDVHLHSNFHHEIAANGNHTAVRVLSIIAWFILIIAWANYFNLSSINILKRSKETAIRQVNGAGSAQIRALFLSESALVNLMAVLFALLIVEVSSPFFARFANVPSISPVWENSWIFYIIGIAFSIGTLTTLIYTSTILKGKNLSYLMKGITYSAKGKGFLRKIMLTVQFCLALGLILSSTVIIRQYHHIMKQEKGINTDDVLVMKVPVLSDSLSMINYQAFRSELSSLASVEELAFSTVVPGSPVDHNIGGLRLEGKDEQDTRNFRLLYAESSYFDLYAIPLVAGEMFSGIFSLDSARVLLNETAVRNFGVSSPEEAIGKRIFRGPQTYHIIGVVGDMHQVSPKEAMEPLTFMAPAHYSGYLSIQLNGMDNAGSLEQSQAIFTSFFPHIPINYYWLESHYDAQNEDERQFGMVFGMFSGLALIITLLGIMGVAAYTAQQRQKEIAIRKTLGASGSGIFMLLFKNYLGQLLLASLIVFPLSYLWLDRWLNQFAMRVDFSWIAFLIPLILVVLTTLFTVWLQSLQILRINPAVTLKE